ncbi:MAG: mechanosensitive ion channel family protein, partial [Allomuricauda sp.]
TMEKISVGVAYGSNVELVTQILEQVAAEQKMVLKNPKPFVLFDDFGDSALQFSLNFFTNDSFAGPRIKSAIRYNINTKFKENNVTIPFPQRDVHIVPQQKPQE